MGDGVWTKERQSNGVKRWALQPTPARPGFEDVVDMLAEIERAWGEIERLSEHLSIANTALEPIERDNERLTAEIERLRAPAPLTEAACTVSAALSDHVSAAAPMSADECARLRAVIVAANNALVDVCRGDHEHQIECHLATLPDEHRRVATAAEKALEILRPVVAEMLEPDRGDIPDDTNPSKISNGSPLTREEARTWAHCALRRGADVPRVTAALLAASRGDIPDDIRPEAEPAVQAAIRGLERVAVNDPDLPREYVPQSGCTACGNAPGERHAVDCDDATLAREEAIRRLDALSPTAVRYLDTARDWLAAYEKSHYRDSERDEMAKILRAYVAGLDAAFNPADPETQQRVKAYVERPDVAARLSEVGGENGDPK